MITLSWIKKKYARIVYNKEKLTEEEKKEIENYIKIKSEILLRMNQLGRKTKHIMDDIVFAKKLLEMGK
ncbi:MAG: hypothetical protein ACP5F8_02625 [Candidatus Aenigmatarchaeota archaeon]